MVQGGKISMALALQEPDLLKSVIVVDIAPVAYSKGTSSQWNVIQQIVETVHNAPVEEMHTRKDMDKHLKNQGIVRSTIIQPCGKIKNKSAIWRIQEEPGIRGFLLQNLVRAENNQGFAWRINTETIVTSLSQLSGFAGAFSAPTLYVVLVVFKCMLFGAQIMKGIHRNPHSSLEDQRVTTSKMKTSLRFSSCSHMPRYKQSMGQATGSMPRSLLSLFVSWIPLQSQTSTEGKPFM